MRPSHVVAILPFLAACASVPSGTSASPPPTSDSVAYSFVVVGCNRVDMADTNTALNPSTANLAQLRKTFEEVAALKPNFLFFAGDLVFGYTSDTVALANELTAWKAIFEESPAKAAGVELVTLPGNHEVQDAKKVAYAAAERTWLRLMAPYLTRGGNGPRAGGADTLRTDQSRLSYSFDFRDAHFLTLNTDPVGADWTVPAQWAASDLAAAKARGARHIFAISHKPAYEYPGAPGDGLSRFPAIRDAFWHAMTSAGADAMLSSHNHVWWAGRPAAQGPWQIIAGNGGSKLQVVPTVPGSGNYSGFTYVMVMNSGRVVAWSYGRDASNPYNAAATPGSSLRETVVIR